MLTKEDAERLKAYMTASWMGIVETVQGDGGCETCGYGAPEYNHIELEGLHKLVDQFLVSPDNKGAELARLPAEPQPVAQEPVAWIDKTSLAELLASWATYAHVVHKCRTIEGDTPLYTTPPDHTAAMRLAVEALEHCNMHGWVLADYEAMVTESIAALRKALGEAK